ncbi:hypothetical protein C5609_15700 [Pseudomonas putida]|uniref:hypothetical protein n=1 Tax=Pseudomonas putida TaxID=303 RepID=UPI00106FA00F|nr:hypothetical protein [Pseudomonas putida]TFF51032.1 hypothetical protein C5609_15700 [Pseudomonas putida]
MNSILDFLQNPASTDSCSLPLYGYGLANLLDAAPAVPPRCGHYNAAAPGIAGLLGQVDENLIRGAMAERASGHHTLH